MRIKRTIRKGLSFVMSLALMLTLLLNVGMMELKAAGTISIKINGTVMAVTPTDTVKYIKNDGTVGNENDYNVKLEYGDTAGTLTLNNMTLDLKNFGLDVISGDIDIVLIGENKIVDKNENASYSAIYAMSNKVSIGGSGSLTIEDASCSSKPINVYGFTLKDSAKLYIDVEKNNNFQYMIYSGGDASIEDSAVLQITVDNTVSDCYGVYVSNASNALNISDSASVLVYISDGGAYNSNTTAWGLYSSGSMVLSTSGTVSLDLTQYNAQGIYATDLEINGTDPVIKLGDAYNQSLGVQAANTLAMSNDADLSITSSVLEASQTSYGKVGYERGVVAGKITMTGDSSITAKLGDANQAYGIYCTSSASLTNSSITVTAGDTQSQTDGVFVSNKIDLADSSIEVKTGTGATMNGVYTYGLCTMTGDSIIDVDVSSVDSNNNEVHGMYVTAGISMSDTSEINTKVAADAINNTRITAYGVRCASTSATLVMEEDAKIVSDLTGDAVQYSYGISSPSITMSGNANISADVAGAKTHASGTAGNTITMNDDSVLNVKTGDVAVGSATSSLCSGILCQASSYVNDNASIKLEVGDGDISAAAYFSQGALNVNDSATVELISQEQALNTLVNYDVKTNFMVKAGSSASGATIMNDDEKGSLSTYTDNPYVLIKAIEIIDEVELAAIDDLVHGKTATASTTTTTTGVSSSIPISWTPAGDIVAGTEYMGTIVITPEDGYIFTADTNVYVDGTETTAVLQNDGTLKATVRKTAAKLNLVSVEGPSGEVVVENGTELKDIRLPGTVAINTDDGNTDQVDVTWNLTNVSYDPTSKEEQVLTITGTPTLPEYVNQGNAVLEVTVKVRVKAATTETTTATEATTQAPSTTSTESTTQAPTTTSTETTTQAPSTTSTEATTATTQAPSTGSMTDTEAPTTASTTTEATDNSDANVKTGDSAPLNMILALMVLAATGMVVMGKKRRD